MPKRRSEAQLESDFCSKVLIPELRELFPGCIILKNDERLQQGISDLTILWYKHWALLEVKAYEHAERQPNQDYYVELGQAMSYGAFIYPENKEAILAQLQHAFSS